MLDGGWAKPLTPTETVIEKSGAILSSLELGVRLLVSGGIGFQSL